MFANWTLRQRLVVMTAASTALVIIVVIALLFGNLFNLIADYASAAVIERGTRVSGTLDARLNEASGIGRDTVAQVGDISNWRAATLWTSAVDALQSGLIDRFALVNLTSNGTGYQSVIFSEAPTAERVIDLNLAFYPDYPADVIPTPPDGAGLQTWFYLPPSSGTPRQQGRIIFIISSNPDVGAFAWIEVSVSRVESWLRETTINSPDALRLNERLLIADNQRVFAALNFPAMGDLPTLEQFDTVFNDIDLNDLDLLPGAFGQDQPQLGASFVVSSTGWRVGLLASSAALVDPVVQNVLLLVGVVLLALVALAWLVNNFTARVVTEPLAELTRGAQEIGTGDLRYNVAYRDRSDEIGELARALEDMKVNIAHSYDALSAWSRTLENRVTERTAQLDSARADALTTAGDLRAVYDASLSVVSEYYLQIILQTLTGRVSDLLRASYAGIWLLTDDNERLELVAATADPSVIGRQIEINEGLVGAVVRGGKPIILDDYPNFERRLPWLADAFTRALAVPLLYSGTVSGAIIAGRHSDGESFTDEDQRRLTLLANLASPVVRNAQLFEELDTAGKAAEQASEVKTRFLASVTHELRTPLNLIINNMDFMRIGAFGEVNTEQEQRLDQTIRSAEHLLYLINDLLDVSKIEAGEMQLFIQMNDLRPVIEDALDATMPMLNSKPDVQITIEMPDTLPYIEMDARRVRQVLLNLLSNAVKFTQQGEVKLIVETDSDHVRFIVSDTGIGIPEAELQGIFEAFERSTRAKELGIEGTGLGMPISRFLVEAHGGSIDVATALGVGTTFTITLPVRQTHHTNGDQTTHKVTGLLRSPIPAPESEA